MGALGIGIGTDGAEALKSGQNALWGGQDGNGIRLEACARGLAGFELALEDEGGEGELFSDTRNRLLGRTNRFSTM